MKKCIHTLSVVVQSSIQSQIFVQSVVVQSSIQSQMTGTNIYIFNRVPFNFSVMACTTELNYN